MGNASAVSLFIKIFLLYFLGGSGQFFFGGGNLPPLKLPPGNPDGHCMYEYDALVLVSLSAKQDKQ